MLDSENFQLLVVGGDKYPAALCHKRFDDGNRQSRTLNRVGSRTQLIYKDK